MNTVRRFSDPHNPWWRFKVSIDGEVYGTPLPHEQPFANSQAMWDWIERHFPYQLFDCQIDFRPDNEQRDLDRYEAAKNDAREDARLEQEELE